MAGLDHTEAHREGLRQMLCRLRKDPMDEDLDQCDGDYFPCEFCGDPYPVEYIMRHQVSRANGQMTSRQVATPREKRRQFS